MNSTFEAFKRDKLLKNRLEDAEREIKSLEVQLKCITLLFLAYNK